MAIQTLGTTMTEETMMNGIGIDALGVEKTTQAAAETIEIGIEKIIDLQHAVAAEAEAEAEAAIEAEVEVVKGAAPEANRHILEVHLARK